MTTGSIFWVVLSAISGGAFVLAGLLMERFSEKDWHKNLSDFRRCKSRNIWGERLVIVGIVVEIGIGIFSAIDAWQVRQMAIKNNPLKQPIASVSATEDILVFDDNLNTNNVFGGNPELEILSGKAADLAFCEKTNPSVDILLVSDGFAKFRISPNEYRLNFHMRPDTLSRLSGVELVSVLDKLDTLYLRNFFLPENSEIEGGTISLSLNSSIRTNFIIPHMKSNGYELYLTLSNGSWVPIPR